MNPLMTNVTPAPFAAMTAFVPNGKKMNDATATSLLTLPFDAMHAQYAVAVRVGLMKSSLLASSRFSRWVCALESCALGPLARHV